MKGLANVFRSLKHTSSALPSAPAALSPAVASSVRYYADAAAAPAAPEKSVKYSVKDGVAIITIDCPGQKVNSLSPALRGEFEEVFNQFQRDSSAQAGVIISGKKDNFIAGADIRVLSSCNSAEELSGVARLGQQLFNDIAESKKPFVAAINGQCLGGGLELALACHYRVATENSKTKLGLPEVMLGLLPGSGGTQRLPKLVGLQHAMPMLLTGKNINATRAKRMGLVDSLAHPAELERAAISVAKGLANPKLDKKGKPVGFKKSSRKKSMIDTVLEDVSFVRDNVVFDKAREMVKKTTRGNYPAPNKIIECVKEGFDNGQKAGLEMELKSFGELGMTNESKGLVSIFFAQTELKKNRFGAPQRDYKNVGILGAGLMGAGIAQVTATNDYFDKVMLKDRDYAALGRGEEQVYKNLGSRVKRRAMTNFDRDVVMSKIVGLSDADNWEAHMKTADMIIEAIPEDIDLKHKVLGGMEKIVPDHCVIATNTSALPIHKIAEGLQDPSRCVGMHYFSPVEKMPLLEVITTDKTSKEASAAAVEVGIKQGKTVIVVGDGPGFYTTRILAPLVAEAAVLMQEGVEVKKIDNIMRDVGFPVGPVTLFDEVGIDVGAKIAKFLEGEFGGRIGGPNFDSVKEMMDAGFFGRKSGAGFYMYNKPKANMVQSLLNKVQGKKGKEVNPAIGDILAKYKISPSNASVEEMQERILFRFINEAVFCLQEDILKSPTDGDIGAIFGLGFPPFLGGPFRYLDRIGVDTFVGKMEKYADKYGERFTVAQLAKDYASGAKKFHA